MLCFGGALSAAEVTHKVGFIEGTNLVDGESTELGNGNKSVHLNMMFYGEMALAGITSAENDKYKEIYDTLNPTVQGFIETTSGIVIFIMSHIYGLIWLGGFVGLIALAIKGVGDAMSGDFIGNYKPWKLFGVPLLFIAITTPWPYYGISTLSYTQLWFNNVDLQQEQKVINTMLATAQRGALDVYKTQLNSDTSKASDTRINEVVSRQQLYTAESIVDSAFMKAMTFTRSSQVRNSYFNKSLANGNIFDKPSDVMKLEDEYYYIEVNNPENNDENVFSMTPILINNALFNLTTANSAMAAINYANTYAKSDDINNASSIANKMNDELKLVGFQGDEGKYRTVKNTAMNMLFIDIRANWIRKITPKLMDDAQQNAILALNSMCAENIEARKNAERYIKSDGKEGFVECVGSDKKVMGTQPAKTYIEAFQKARKAQVDALYNQIMALNTAYMNAMQTSDLDKIYSETIDCGAFCFLKNFRTIRNQTAFSAPMLNQFAQGGFATFSEINAVGDYAMTDYFRDKAGFAITLQLPVEAFVKAQLSGYTTAMPNLNSDELIQKAIVRNGIAGVQDNDVAKAQNSCLQMPDRQFRTMIMSNQDTVRSFYIYGQELLGCATKLAEVSLGIKIAAFVGNTVVNSKEGGTKGVDAAQIGKVSNKGKSSGFDWNGLFNVLDSIADIGLYIVIYLTLLALTFMFLILVAANFIPLIIYILFRFYVVISPIFITFNSVTALRSNDDNNFERIRNNVIATLLMPVVAGPAILALYVFGLEIAEVVCKGALEMFFVYGSIQLSGNNITQYIMLILTLAITFYTVQMTSLAVTVYTLASILKTVGFGKHIPFMGDAIKQLDRITNILNALGFFGFSGMRAVAGFLTNKGQRVFRLVNPFKRKTNYH